MKKLYFLLLMFTAVTSQAQWWTSDTLLNNAVVTGFGTTSKSGSVTCSDGAGGVYIAWLDNRNSATTGTDVYVQRLLANGTVAFSTDGILICNAANGQSNLSITPDGSGGAVIAWQDPRTTPSLVYAQRINSVGTILWGGSTNTLGVNVFQSNTAQQVVPTLVTTSNNEIFVILRDSRNATTGSDLYAQKLNPTTGAPVFTTDLAIVTATNVQTGQVAVADNSGNVLVAWADPRLGTTNSMIYVQKITSTGTLAWAGGTAANGGVALTTSPLSNNRSAPQITYMGGGNGAVVAWVDNRNGNTNADIFAQYITEAAGAPQWTANGVGICTETTTSQSSVSLATTSDGQVFCAWTDPRNNTLNSNDIFGTKIAITNGAPFSSSWPVNGLAIVDTTGSQTNSAATLLPTSNGGVVISWTDGRGAANDIYYQVISSNAVKLLADKGAPISVAPQAQGSGTLTNAGTDLFICTFQDGRNGTSNSAIYAAAINASTGVLLPIQFIQFSGLRNGGNTRLAFTTAQEFNVVNYVIEQSENGTVFTAIGTLISEQRANASYVFNTSNSVAKGHFFRIIAVTNDGKKVYSPIIKLAAQTSAFTAVLTPNVVSSTAFLQVQSPEAKRLQIRLVGNNGVALQIRTVDISAGTTSLPIDVSNLLAGTYWLQLQTNTQTTETLVLIKK
jgi:hypothetical protein